jgi:hypothetical protein
VSEWYLLTERYWNGTNAMNTKFLLLLTWFFYMGMRRSGDDIWLFCLAIASLSTVCAFFYRMDNKNGKSGAKIKSRSV